MNLPAKLVCPCTLCAKFAKGCMILSVSLFLTTACVSIHLCANLLPLYYWQLTLNYLNFGIDVMISKWWYQNVFLDGYGLLQT